MPSPGQLVHAMATITNEPEETLVIHDRNLANAGLRTKGGRGWSAAKVTPRDAAHLLIAVMASPRVKDSVATVERYAKSSPRLTDSSPKLFGGLGVSELTDLPADHSFIDALERLIASAATGSLAGASPSIEVAALMPGTLGDIRIAGTGKKVSRQVRYAATPKSATGKTLNDLERYSRISDRTILSIAKLFEQP